METISEKDPSTVDNPTNRCTNSVFMELSVEPFGDSNDSQIYIINSILTIAKATIKLGKQNNKVGFGITHGSLELSMKGCHSIPDPYMKFAQSSPDQQITPATDSDIDDILENISPPTHSKKLAGLLEKVGISNIKKKDNNELFEQLEEDYINETDVNAKGTPQNPSWEFRANIHNDELFLEQSFSSENLAHVKVHGDSATIEANFSIPLDGIYIIESDYIPSDLSPEKSILIKTVLRKHIWTNYFYPHVSSQTITI